MQPDSSLSKLFCPTQAFLKRFQSTTGDESLCDRPLRKKESPIPNLLNTDTLEFGSSIRYNQKF